VGKEALTDAVVNKMDQELEAHELIKVRLQDGCSDPAKELYPVLAEQSHSELVQIIGKIGVFYRRRKKDPAITLPKPQRRGGAESAEKEKKP
jgi:RNA-binding protein